MPKKQPESPDTNDSANEMSADESNELDDFLKTLGPSNSDVTLYRLEPTGKQRFVTTGPPSQFSEMYVQQTFGGGDYLARIRIKGKLHGSKHFSIADKPVADTVHSHNAEIERLRAEMEAQRLQMERDRQQREQRNHELFLEALRHGNGGGGGGGAPAPPVSIADLVMAVKSMKDMAAGNNPQDLLNQSLETIQRINTLRGGTPAQGEAPVEWWQAALGELARFGEKLIPYVPQIMTALTTPAAAAVSPIINPAPSGVLALPPKAPYAAAETDPVPGPDKSADPPAPDVANLRPTGASVPTADEFQAYKKQIIQMVLPIALAGSSPELYAELAFDQMRKGDIGILKLFDELIGSPDFENWFLALQQLDSAVTSQRDWFARFYDAVRQEYAAAQQEQQTNEQE